MKPEYRRAARSALGRRQPRRSGGVTGREPYDQPSFKALVAEARDHPDDPGRLVSVRDELFVMRETLDELGVPFSLVANDDPDLAGDSARAAEERAAEWAREKYGTLVASFAPARSVGVFGGVPVSLVSVELWTSGVLVRVSGIENALTKEMDSAHEAAIAEWTPQVVAARKAGERGPDPPAQPGAMLMEIPLRVFDDVGTDYRAPRKSAGGSGSEWDATWHFQPAVPGGAARLTIAVDDADGGTHLHELSLHDPRELV